MTTFLNHRPSLFWSFVIFLITLLLLALAAARMISPGNNTPAPTNQLDHIAAPADITHDTP